MIKYPQNMGGPEYVVRVFHKGFNAGPDGCIGMIMKANSESEAIEAAMYHHDLKRTEIKTARKI